MGEQRMGLHPARGERDHLQVAVAVRLAVHGIPALVDGIFRAGDGEVADAGAPAVQRHLPAAAHREQHLAARRIDSEAALLHLGHGGTEGLLQRAGRRGIQAARRVQRIGRIERRGVELGSGHLHAAPELIPHVRAARIAVAGVVPGTQGGAGGGHVHGGAADRDLRRGADQRERLVLEALGTEDAAVQDHLAHDGAGGLAAAVAVGASQALQRHGVAQARAQALLGAGGTEDGRVAGERRIGVGEPVAVVHVAHVVVALQVGHARRADGALLHGIRIGLPVAGTAGAVEERHARQRRCDGLAVGRGAGGQLARGHVGHRAHVGIPGPGAPAPHGHGVDPGNGGFLALDGDEFVERAGLVPAHPVAEGAVVLAIDVADGEGGGLVPCQRRIERGQVHQRPHVGLVERARHIDHARCRAVLHRDGSGRHLHRGAVAQVAGGIARGQRELEEAEAARAGDRVAPGHVVVEADQHHRDAQERHPAHVQLVADGELRLVEAVGPLPVPVRVAEE